MNSRRTFLKQAGLAAAGTFLLPSFADALTNKAPKKVGIQLYTLRSDLPKDVTGVIKKVAQMGYKEVETYGYSVDNGFWGLDAKSFASLLKENGLKAPSGHYGLDKYMLDGNTDVLKTYIEAANITRGEYITVPHLGTDLRKNLDDYKKIAARLNQAAELCRASGLKLAYHNHNFEFDAFGNSYGYDILLKETDPKLVQFELDLYWVVRSGKDPVKFFEANPGRFPMWHIKDMDKADRTKNTEVGNGSINFKSIYAASKLAGLKHAFVEQENNYAPDLFKSIENSIGYINKELI
ncbi:sugar phosphate isomerase/epimerase [Pedobacter sp. MC2016-14]|uniref:sugar phosphate isomerase/epimerase family protein n=1 Tax=Pedobacter sp. MC2016-14 TaxID=2897327 RepID=UPI001E5B22D4|nr:sugar phosphate isomerase/epimerase [Pedobacter sp. MC2016-14]MCD0486638.1 sugar phosphate isomerase/epimerase [Pedobacter sp. MC2016-14]